MSTPTASPAATEGNLGISGDVRRRAGVAAEKQMAHYLHREFGRDSEIHMVHGLRLIDADQPEPDGNVGVCQIDHLVIHRWGMFIVESKSVTEEIRVRSDGSQEEMNGAVCTKTRRRGFRHQFNKRVGRPASCGQC